MDGTSAINILYQYPLWSLSQSAEMTFVIFLFCWYRIWCFHSMCVLILLMYHTRCWPTCIFVFFVCFTQRICIAKICLVVRKCVSMKYNVWIHAEFQAWLRKQDILLFKTHFLKLSMRDLFVQRHHEVLWHINRSVFYVSTTFILTNNNWIMFWLLFSHPQVLLKVVSYRKLCAHWDPKCVYINT